MSGILNINCNDYSTEIVIGIDYVPLYSWHSNIFASYLKLRNRTWSHFIARCWTENHKFVPVHSCSSHLDLLFSLKPGRVDVDWRILFYLVLGLNTRNTYVTRDTTRYGNQPLPTDAGPSLASQPDKIGMSLLHLMESGDILKRSMLEPTLPPLFAFLSPLFSSSSYSLKSLNPERWGDGVWSKTCT